MESFLFGEGASLTRDELFLTQANRPPFLFMDEAFDVIPNKQAGSTFNFREEWELFAVHFPSSPMVPATIMLEMMMQTSALAPLLDYRDNACNKKIPLVYLTKVVNSKFSEKILPNNVVNTLTTITWLKGSFGITDCEVLGADKNNIIASATMHFYCDFN